MKPSKNSLDERLAWMRERQERTNATPVPQLEAPLTVQEAAIIWGQSEKATRRYFAKVDGVRLISNPARYDKKRDRRIRKYDIILIPPSVL
jgi:hypothetical protein